MFIGAHKWSLPDLDISPPAGAANQDTLHPRSQAKANATSRLYHRLLQRTVSDGIRTEASEFLHGQLSRIDRRATSLPEAHSELEDWMTATAHNAACRYSAYLAERKAGAPRRYFSNRSHALYFLRSVAPTKLVDGAWLFGLMSNWRNPRLTHLVRTYLEELGEGSADKNHVLIYRQLLQRHGIDPNEKLDEAFYTQGLIQLCLACNAEEFLPEIIGFNLGYEQLPLHLLITAHELDELGLDPYYFTLHITVDNPDAGHARRAVQAVMDTLPKFGNEEEFWQRVRLGSQLGDAGIDTCAVIDGFDIEREVHRIFKHKSAAGQGVHSNFCRVGGRHVNDWLAQPDEMPVFLAELEKAGWIKRGEPAESSRFWGLLQGPRAEMFGVFSSYELQLIHDWIRGDASVDGAPYDRSSNVKKESRLATFRAATRLASVQGCKADHRSTLSSAPDSDSDAQDLLRQLHTMSDAGQYKLLVKAMSPDSHWTPAGLLATRLFCRQMALQ